MDNERKPQALVIRTFDIILSVIGLLFAAPLFPVIAILIKLSSRGPVFFPTPRVGKDMKLFPMYKFRTMLERSKAIDQSICPQHDPRVTTVGRLLRRTKLNELPQFLNILRGDMSFVGPRPEAPDLVAMYPDDAKRVFSVKPGLVGPAVISMLRGGINGRNEEELYPKGVDPKEYYIKHILPEKIKIDLYYLSRQTVGTYFKVIIGALRETIFGVFGVRQADHSKRQIYLFIADFVLGQLTYGFAYLLYVHSIDAVPSFEVFIIGLLLVIIARPTFFYLLGLYNFVIELITRRDISRVPKAVGLGSVLMLALSAFNKVHFYPPFVALVDFSFLAALLTSIRLLIMIRFRAVDKSPGRRTRIFIFGANREGLRALHMLAGARNSPYNAVGFIDDAEEKYGKRIGGIKVLGNRYHIRALSVLHNVHEMILALDDGTREEIDEVVALCAQAGVRSRIFSRRMETETMGAISYPVRPVTFSDMLPEVKVSLDETVLRSILPDRTVLMFGSGGALGSAICRYVFKNGCRRLIIVDRFESQLNQTLAELMSDLPGNQIVPVVLDSQDSDGLNDVFARHRPQIVIHAGMRKFISLQKSEDEEVARSNYVRTFSLAKVAAWHGCEYFVMISSIKATRGGSFISESLRVAEISLGRIFSRTPTRLIVSRVGNIIENRGGIVSWLSDQILEGKPLRLPAHAARAFLLSKDAAARSVLQALATGSRISPGGQLLTSEPGVSLEFAEIARKIANFYGIKLGVDIPVDSGQTLDELIYDEPSLVQPESERAALDSLEDCLKLERVRRMIESLISSEAPQLSAREWHRRTEEIIALCGSSLFSQKRFLSAN